MTALTKENWILSGEVGISSKTIWAHFTMNLEPQHTFAPSDPSDFLRCYWLLQLAPEWRARIGELGTRYPGWKPLTDAWDELEVMLVKAWPLCCASGKYADEPPAKEMYRRMKVLLKEK